MGEFRLLQFTLVAIFVIALLGLNVLTGYSGQISLCHGAFVGVGAYVTALLSLGRPGLGLLQIDPPSWVPLGNGMTPIFTIPIAALITGVIGLLVGIPALRLGGISLALATLATQLLPDSDEALLRGDGRRRRHQPHPGDAVGWDIPRATGSTTRRVTAGILFVLARLLVRGRIGRAWRAIRDGEVAAISPA
jgi:branched-chain amino acid transport system permease protein